MLNCPCSGSNGQSPLGLCPGRLSRGDFALGCHARRDVGWLHRHLDRLGARACNRCAASGEFVGLGRVARSGSRDEVGAEPAGAHGQARGTVLGVRSGVTDGRTNVSDMP